MTSRPPLNENDGCPDRRSETGIEAFRPGLTAFLRTRLSQESDIEDCIQAVAIKWLAHREQLTKGSVRAWLITVAANEAAMIWRKRQRLERAVRQKFHDSAVEHEADVEHGEPSEVEREELRSKVREAISSLPDELRMVVEKRLDEGRTFESIASELDIPLGTALSRMHRALRVLRTKLAEWNSL